MVTIEDVAIIAGPVVTDEVVIVTVVVAVSCTVEAARVEDAVSVAGDNVTVLVKIEIGPDTLFVFVTITAGAVVVQGAPVTVRTVERAEPVEVTVLVTSEM